MEHIRLVLVPIAGAEQMPSAFVPTNSGMMPGNQDIGAEGIHPVEQSRKPHLSIALDARVRSSTGEVAVSKRLNNGAGELVDVVEHVIRHVELGGDAPGILSVGDGAAAGGRHLSVGSDPLLQRHSDDLEPCLRKLGGQGKAHVTQAHHTQPRSPIL